MYDVTSEEPKISFIEPRKIVKWMRKFFLEDFKKILKDKNCTHRLVKGNI